MDKIIELLKSKKVIDENKASQLKTFTRAEEIFDFLSKDLDVDQELLTQVKAEYYGLKYADLVGTEIKKENLNLLSKEIAGAYKIVVFDKDNDKLKVGLVKPKELKGQEAAEFVARQKKLKIEYYVISEKSFDLAFKQYTALKAEVEKALDVAEDKMQKQKKKDDVKKKAMSVEDVEEVIKSAPISKMVEVIIKHGVESRASDIHIEPFTDQTRVRYRIDGVLRTMLLLPKAVHATIVSRIKVLSNLKIDETRVPQDGRIRLNIEGENVDFRISTLPLYEQEKVVMRILDTSSGALTLDALGFQGKNLDIIKTNIVKPHGMFLVTGPTGSGKSTTLYSVLNILNKEGVNIVTLEDPVEYYLKGVNQSQVNADVGLTFAAGLRSILRQDPDVVMVGEIRDNETAELAIHAALTGHTVLSTLHTNDAFGAIPRLFDMKVEPFLLTSTLNIVLAQRLVRKVCDKCKEEYDLPEKLKDFAWNNFSKIPKDFLVADVEHISDKKDMKFFHGKGCKHCHDSGYAGRLAIVEALDMTDSLKETIASGTSLEKVKQEVVSKAMLNLLQDGIVKSLQGKTTIEEIMRVTKE